MAEPAFVLGHELQHGFNRAATKTVNNVFLDELKAEAKKPAPSHDYTLAIEKRLAQNRRDEAGAEVAGWNALAGQVKAVNPNATLGDIFEKNHYRTADFIDKSNTSPPTYTLKPNLTLNPDMTLSQTLANIEAMGGGDSGGPNHCAAGVAVSARRDTEVVHWDRLSRKLI